MQELVRSAVRAQSMSALTDLLHVIAQQTGSYGCILWRLAPSQSAGASGDRLFVVAEWFDDDKLCANHSLSLETSFTGVAISTQVPQHVMDISMVKDPDPFLRDAGITSFYSTPITFADEVLGAVNIYRKDSASYDQPVLDLVRRLAETVPSLLQVIEDEVSFRLISVVDSLLAGLRHSIPAVSPFEHVKPTMTQLCYAVAEALNCVEASVFLEDRFEAKGEYRLAGTTWNQLVFKPSYKATEHEGVTGWSLAHPERPVIIFDLADEAAIARKYRGMRWLDSLDIKSSLRGHPKIRDLDRLPPLSYMSAPILDDQELVGIVRCSVGVGPVYFDERQHAILQRIASGIGPFWSTFLRNRSLEALVENIRNLNSFAPSELMKEKPEEHRILAEALRITQAVVPGAEITDVRLLNEDQTELRFAVPYGEAWEKGTAEEKERRKNRVYNVKEDPPKSVGVHVIQTGKTYVVKDPKNDPFYFENFPNTRRMIVAPLALGAADAGEIYGVLDIRTSIDRDFPDFAIRISELLASQLALYRKLGILVRDLNQTVRDLKKLKDQQTQINEDLAHQLKSPTMTAHRRVNDLLRGMPDSETKTQLLRIRGVCARAMHVAMNSWLFARLARGQTVTANKQPLKGEDLWQLVLNTTFDASYLSRGEQKHTFWVDPAGFRTVQVLNVDRDLLEQALTQLLDNAFKYSFRDAQVSVTGGYTKSSQRKDRDAARVRVSVTSEGVPLESNEVALCTERGWQSEEAQKVSGSGSGIGLWIVHHIMEAHNGKLEVTPTDNAGRTTFSLIFPVQ